MKEYDVIVCGGGTSGVIAAISAARNGASTLLVEHNAFLGGTLVCGLGWLGFRDRSGHDLIGGIGAELIERLEKTNDTLGHNYCPILNDLTPVNGPMVQLILMDLCVQAGVHVLLQSDVIEIHESHDRIDSVTVLSEDGRTEFSGKVIIDATGDGVVSQMAGIPMVERKAKSEIQPASLIFMLSGVDREALLEYLEKNPDEAKTPEGYEMETSAETYRNAKGYNVLGCDALIRSAREHHDYNNVPRDRFSTITTPLPDRMTINNTRIMNFDGSDVDELSAGILEGYHQLAELLHFIPKYIPGYEDAQLSGLAPMLGIRESRRCIGEQTLTGTDILEGRMPDDTVALGGYNIDIHHGGDEGSELYIVREGYGISYRTMMNRKVRNLIFTGRLISTDRDAFGSSRVMGTCMALGEAAGCAGALCAQQGLEPLELDVQQLRKHLIDQKMILEVKEQ